MVMMIQHWRTVLKNIRRTLSTQLWVVIGVCWVLAAPVVCIVHCHWHAPSAPASQLYVCEMPNGAGDSHATGLAALPLTVLLALELVVFRSGNIDVRRHRVVLFMRALVSAWQLVRTPPPKMSLIHC